MSIINKLLGRKKPTTANLSLELEAKKAALADAERRFAAAASARQAAIEDQDKAAIVLADAAKLDAEQDVALAMAAIAALQAAHAEAAAIEAREALEARTQAALRLVRERAPDLLKFYDKLAADIVQVVEEFEAINLEVEAINRERRKAGLELIADANQAHRKEADRHIPERREKRKKWVHWNSHAACWEDVGVFSFEGERRVPNIPGAREVEEEHVTQRAEVKRGAELPWLGSNVVLPAGRLGGSYHWPKRQS